VGEPQIRILVLHGPNLNLLGRRETSIYGKMTLEEIDRRLRELARAEAAEIEIRQSNSEADLVGWVQDAVGRFQAIVVNPAAFTHTSIALRDAVAATGIPTYEVHISNIYQREPFRHLSYIAPVAVGQISGMGPEGYLLALRAAIGHLKSR
jgi:3-dehydroquinate dehydratase-2